MPVFESSRKVQVFGSSLAMTLPAMFVKACEIKKGSELDVLYGLDGVLVLANCGDAHVVIASLNDIMRRLNDSKSSDVVYEAEDSPIS